MKTLAALLVSLTLLCACATAPAPALNPAPAELGRRIAEAYLVRGEFMMYQVNDVTAVHYADVASAYGVSQLAAATHDDALMARVIERHRRLLAQNIPNTANHVDANIYGAWPLEIFLRTQDRAELARGLPYADDQWRNVGGDGLTTQARYWIDDIWMIGTLQNQAFRATGDERYIDRAANTAAAYIVRLQQPNGLFFHGPDAPFFWGRGNGWVAAGLAEVLTELPRTHADYPAVEAGYVRMMEALLRYQDEDGMWRQLIDYPEAWKETSSTAMFGYAMAVGVRRGILRDRAYADAYARAWNALATYVEPDGNIRQVCVGTGQSRDAQYYLDRPTVTGDLHGQAPMLWFAAELLKR